ncbi:hypothetical protein EON65_58990 [archaeon]|nr:MAG: hypothetical protein EON65_58990 [archaeon]
MWLYLKEEVRQQPVSSSKENLWLNVQMVLNYMWSEDMTKKINEMYKSLPNCMQAVIEAHGGNTSY